MKFLESDGPYAVGSVTCRLTDTTRPAHLASRSIGRELIVKVWYPCRATGDNRELLWEELRRDEQVPRGMRILLKLVRASTSTRPGAPFDATASIRSIVVYNHGMISFASENTSLMEHLASRGNIVIALRHVEQLGELQCLNRERTPAERRAFAERQRRLQTAPRDERARLAVEYYGAATNTNRIVVERALDTSFVLDRLAEVLAQVPGFVEDAAGDRDCDLVGFSLGGAVASEAARRDSRVRSAVNLDGGMYGAQRSLRIRQPYLMMYSSANDGINDALLPDHAARYSASGTAHLNYHDISAILPLLRYANALGKVNARAFLAHRNRVVESFLSRGGVTDVDAG